MHPLQPFWDLALAQVQAGALDLALELGLFAELVTPHKSAELAGRLSLHPDNAAHLLELLWSFGLLDRLDMADEPPRYRTSEVAARYFSATSPTYCGDAWRYRLRSLRQAGAALPAQLSANYRRPRHMHSIERRSAWADAARLQIAQEQRAASVPAALSLFERLPARHGPVRLLDLGGGPGLVAIALAQANPHLSGRVFDYPETAEIARQNILAAGLGDRLDAWGGELEQDDWGGGYDLIWCASVLHFVADPKRLLARLHTALRPGGVLLCAHAEAAAERDAARRVLPYYLAMRLQGRALGEAGHLNGELQAAGFEPLVSEVALGFPVAPVRVEIVRRPRGKA